MGLFEIFMIGVGLSMDAFAASICKGLNMRRLNIKNMLIIGLFFGGFQALMPAVGWLLGKQFESYITSVDHWVAFALLVFIGGKMIYDVFADRDEGDCGEKSDRLDMKDKPQNKRKKQAGNRHCMGKRNLKTNNCNNSEA